LSTTINLPDGRRITVPVDDIELAKKIAVKYSIDNPRIQRGAQLGDEDVSVFGDVARGVGAGVVQAVAGVAALPAELIDLATLDEGEESVAESVDEFFDKFTPETYTGAGEAVKFMTQFIVPGGIAAKAAGKAGQGLSKARKLGVQTGAFAGADFAVSTPDVETMGDFFESGPTKRTELENLEGIDLAQARIGNRFKVATEGALMSLGITGAFATPKLIRAGLDKTAESDLLKNAAQKIVDDNKPFAKLGLQPEEAEGVFGKAFQKGKKIFENNFTFKGDLPDRFVADLKASRIAQVAAQDQLARNGMEEITNGIKILTKAGVQNSTDEAVALDALQSFIFAEKQGLKDRGFIKANAEKTLKELDQKIQDVIKNKSTLKKIFTKESSILEGAKKIRDQIDNLSDRIIRSDNFIDDELKETIIKNRGFYGTRIYRAFNDTNFDPFEGVEGGVNAAKKEAYDKAIEELNKTLPKGAPKLSEKEANDILKSLVDNKEFHNAYNTPKNITDVESLNGVAQGPLKGRSLDSLPAIRDFLGEYSGGSKVIPGKANVNRQRTVAEQREGIERRVVETIDRMSKTLFKKDYFDNLVKHNDTLKADNKFIFDEQPLGTGPNQYQQIGKVGSEAMARKFGALNGKYVKAEHYRAFNDAPKLMDSWNDNSLYATFLGVKGISQIMKTVYSPITQIRNATTAAMFALANGNIGNGRELVNSFKVIMSEINQKAIGKNIDTTGSEVKLANKKDIDDYYSELIDLGVVNSNAKVGEFEDLLKDAVTGKEGSLFTTKKGSGFLNFFKNTQNRLAGKLYQGSDDVWKTYSYEMELGKLKNAFSKDPNASITIRDAKSRIELAEQGIDVNKKIKISNLDNLELPTGKYVRNSRGDSIPEMVNAKDLILKREAAQLVKDTVPNYARVPKIISNLRRTPFGNFVAFPAEILRTNFNIAHQAARELASESAEIRSIGMRRLTGSLAVNGGIGATLTTAGQLLTGTDKEQINAWKRSVAAPWDKYSTLIPVASDKDGKITEMYNFSYTNPYDFATRPFRALYEAVGNGITEEKDLMSIVGNAAYDSVKEFASPFMDESIITEKITDIARNQTRFGRQIHLEADTFGDIQIKRLLHLLDGVNPGFMPVKVQSGELAFRDFPKAVGSMVGVDPEKTVSRSGGQIDAAGELVASLTGLKSVKPYLKDTLMYRTYEAADQVRESARIFNRVAKSRGRVSADDITNAYIKSNEQRFKKLRDLHTAIDDARTLGMSESDIYQVLKQAKAPNVNYLMAGKFKPFFPSNETMMFAITANENKLSNPFNMSDITRSYSSQAGRDFKPRAVEQAIEERRQKQIELRQKLAEQAQQQTSSINMPQPTQLFNRPSAGTAALRQVELDKLLGTD